MYRISDETLVFNAFIPAGMVRAISPSQFEIDAHEVPGLVIYIMRVKGEYMKGGQASSFVERMDGEFGCLRPVIAAGPPYIGDPWKRYVPFTLLETGAIVELWAKSYTDPQEMGEDETQLNDFYRGRWTREGQAKWRPKTRHRTTVSTLRLERHAL